MRVKDLKKLIEFLADDVILDFYDVNYQSFTPISFLIRDRDVNRFSLCNGFLHYDGDKELFEVIDAPLKTNQKKENK